MLTKVYRVEKTVYYCDECIAKLKCIQCSQPITVSKKVDEYGMLRCNHCNMIVEGEIRG